MSDGRLLRVLQARPGRAVIPGRAPGPDPPPRPAVPGLAALEWAEPVRVPAAEYRRHARLRVLETVRDALEAAVG